MESSGVHGTRDDGIGQVQVLLPYIPLLELAFFAFHFIVFFVYLRIVKCVLLVHS